MWGSGAETLNAEDIPARWQEPGIRGGYRRPGVGFCSALRSAFLWTNETVNIWSHLLAGLLWAANRPSHNLPPSHPFLAFHTTLAGTALLSATAHTFNILGECVNDLCYLADYAVISTHTFHVAMALHSFGLPPAWTGMPGAEYHAWLCLMAALSCVLVNALSRFHTTLAGSQWPARLRGICFVLSTGLMYAPLAIRFLGCLQGSIGGDGDEEEKCVCLGGEELHASSLLFQVFAVGAYATHFPESWWPGRFDQLGNSHNLLHLLGVIGGEFQFRALFADLAIPRKSPEFVGTILGTYYQALAILLTTLVAGLLLRSYTHQSPASTPIPTLPSTQLSKSCSKIKSS